MTELEQWAYDAMIDYGMTHEDAIALLHRLSGDRWVTGVPIKATLGEPSPANPGIEDSELDYTPQRHHEGTSWDWWA